MDSNGVAVLNAKEVQVSPALAPPGAMSLIENALRSGATMEQVGQLIDLQARMEASEAKKAFVAAMSNFKGEVIRIRQDRENKQYGSRYTSLGNLVQTVTPFLSKHGLSARWDMKQTQKVEVICILTHVQGHSESVAMEVPPDNSGAKNPIQQIKSSITYAKSCTFESICGLASTDANLDDDGNASGKAKMHEGELSEALQAIRMAETTEELKQAYDTAKAEAKIVGDQSAVLDIVKAKDERKRQLQEGSR